MPIQLSLTTEKKKAIIRIIGEIACADGKIQNVEKTIIMDLCHNLKMSEQDFLSSAKITLIDACNIAKEMTMQEKQYLSDCMCFLSISDAEIADREILTITHINQYCHLPSANTGIELMKNVRLSKQI